MFALDPETIAQKKCHNNFEYMLVHVKQVLHQYTILPVDLC